MAAAKTALADGGLEAGQVAAKRFGVLIGSGVGGLEAVETSCRCAASFTSFIQRRAHCSSVLPDLQDSVRERSSADITLPLAVNHWEHSKLHGCH